MAFAPRLEHFRLTDEHIKLLRAAYVGWEDAEAGAPCIDCKRPYGNSDVTGDIGEILGEEPLLANRHGDREFTQEQEERFLTLHRETEQALRVVLQTGSFVPGHYVTEQYRNNWRRVEGE